VSEDSTLCLCVSSMLFRNGRPGIFLRDLCVPAERRHDEPVLHLRCLPQVSPLHLLVLPRHTQLGITEKRRMFLIVRSISVVSGRGHLSKIEDQTKDDLCLTPALCLTYLTPPPCSFSHCVFVSSAGVDWVELLPQCVFSSITVRWVHCLMVKSVKHSTQKHL